MRVEARFGSDDRGAKLYVYVLVDGELRGYVELEPGPWEGTYRFFAAGITLDGRYFMESGYEAGDMYAALDADPSIFAEMLETGTFSRYAFGRRRYAAGRRAVERLLEAAREEMDEAVARAKELFGI